MADEQPTAILTKRQREYLRGEREPTQERTMRTRIRERARAGIVDFALLANGLPDDDRDAIFELTGEQADADLYNGVAKFIELVYLGAPDGVDFEGLLEFALYNAEMSRHRMTGTTIDVDLSVEVVQHHDLDEALEKFEAGDSMTYEEIGALLASGRLEEGDVERLADLATEQGYTPNFTVKGLPALDDFLAPDAVDVGGE